MPGDAWTRRPTPLPPRPPRTRRTAPPHPTRAAPERTRQARGVVRLGAGPPLASVPVGARVSPAAARAGATSAAAPGRADAPRPTTPTPATPPARWSAGRTPHAAARPGRRRPADR